MNEQVLAALNHQIRMEFQAAYGYLAMSGHFQAENFDGFSKWMRRQAQEEVLHAMRLFDFVLRRGGRLNLEGLEGPSASFGTPLQVFETALAHEREVTQQIHRLYELTIAKADHASRVELEWFIAEQVEEEDTATRIVERLRLAGDSAGALLLLDSELGARAATERSTAKA